MRRAVKPLILLVALLLVAAACGQKSGVANTAVATDDGGTAGASGGATDGEAAPAEREAGPDDTAGISDDEIVIGVHAPVTGASPIPQTSFDIGKDIYWKFLADSDPESFGGREVRVVFRDDEFNPNRAVSVCREMVEQENAFLLVGGGGADQITACAKYADGIGVPYISAGVNQEGLADLGTYFALSLSYAEQAPLLVALIEELGLTKVGVVVADTPSFADGHDAFVEAAEAADLEIVTDDTINKAANPTEQLSEAQNLKDAGAEVVFILTSPVVYLGVANNARNQDFEPVFVGPGITAGLNAVTEFGCPGVSNGQFYSPFPGLDVIDELDPDFRQAYEQFGDGAEADDIGLALWALNKTLALMMAGAGEELGRAALMNSLEEGEAYETGVYPPVSISADDHFGGTGAHLLKADCDQKVYE
ncbi:MAG: ABC transporter substrate-binding protein, partial [Actinomycetota bacterium]|nr:ABC transporter substrate-binding protein [Actinomycetota bacterium]